MPLQRGNKCLLKKVVLLFCFFLLFLLYLFLPNSALAATYSDEKTGNPSMESVNAEIQEEIKSENMNTTSSYTPIWITFVGWGVTLLAAIIPAWMNRRKNLHLEEDIRNLRQMKASTIDTLYFLEQRKPLLQELDKLQNALASGNTGISTYRALETLLTRVDSYGKRLSFTDEDQKRILLLLNKVKDYITDGKQVEKRVRPAEIEAIKCIVEKGEYGQ